MTDGPSQSGGLVADFCEEAVDLIENAAESMAEYARQPDNAEAINLVFRSVHTIKGNAGFFNLQVVKRFAHSLEDALDEVRQGIVTLNDELGRGLIEGIDILGAMVAEIQEGGEDANPQDYHADLLARIKTLCDSLREDSGEGAILKELLSLAEEIASANVPQSQDWATRLQSLAEPEEGEEGSGEDGSAGEVVELDPETLLEANFQCAGEDVTAQVKPLLGVFPKVNDGSYKEEDGQEFLNAIDAFKSWAEEQKQAEIVEALSAARNDFATVFNSPLDMDPYLVSAVWQRLGPLLTELSDCKAEPAAADQPSEEAAASDAPKGNAKQDDADAGAKKRVLRVREDRVDNFLEDVSNLFITCERLKDLQLRMVGQFRTHELVDELRQINATLSSQSTILQRSVVELRKVPVRGLFSKFPRVARTLANKLGKQLDVHLEGEDIEIDKSLVDDLDGPLMHMVRNVCDHGIESPEEREERGAPAAGNLWMSCALTNTHVVVTVRDDGRGIDGEKLRRKALEKSIAPTEELERLSEQEAVELVFHPGFSTAEKISEISGRGVGLDVVRTQVRSHNGDVRVVSQIGEGTTFHLEIPIRKAVVVVDGLLVTQNNTTFAIPFGHIKEITQINLKDMSTVQGKPVAKVRGEPYPAVSLSEVLKIKDSNYATRETHEGVLIEGDQKSVLLLVDTVMGHRKVVISDMSDVLPGSEQISGVAQLGGGRLALVLNAEELVSAAWHEQCAGV